MKVAFIKSYPYRIWLFDHQMEDWEQEVWREAINEITGDVFGDIWDDLA